MIEFRRKPDSAVWDPDEVVLDVEALTTDALPGRGDDNAYN
ncbi:hypothetical protein [Streptomyces sp. NPDC001604]